VFFGSKYKDILSIKPNKQENICVELYSSSEG